jgi:hypothetical protein
MKKTIGILVLAFAMISVLMGITSLRDAEIESQFDHSSPFFDYAIIACGALLFVLGIVLTASGSKGERRLEKELKGLKSY